MKSKPISDGKHESKHYVQRGKSNFLAPLKANLILKENKHT